MEGKIPVNFTEDVSCRVISRGGYQEIIDAKRQMAALVAFATDPQMKQLFLLLHQILERVDREIRDASRC